MVNDTDKRNTDAKAPPSSSLQVRDAASAWFLGPRAENSELLKELFTKVIEDHLKARSSFHPEDGVR